MNPKSGQYSLDQFNAFAGNNPESLREILVAFISSGLKNVALFRRALQEKNRTAVGELAHKMLPLFRQLQAGEITSVLSQLERKDMEPASAGLYFLMGQTVLGKIEEILEILQENENIHLN